MRAQNLATGCVQVKVRRADFTTFTRQKRFEPSTTDSRTIARIAAELLTSWLGEQPRARVRLLGVGVNHLHAADQMDLFASPTAAPSATALDATLDEIRERFGDCVAGLVEEMSDSVVDTTAGETKAPWLVRKEAYIAGLGHKSESAALIKAADQISNLGDCLEDYRKVGDSLWMRFNTGCDHTASKRRALTLWYHRAVLDGLRARRFPRATAILGEVAEVLDRLERESAT
jgi:hypothetical protein